MATECSYLNTLFIFSLSMVSSSSHTLNSSMLRDTQILPMVRNDCYEPHLLFNFIAFSLTFPLNFTKTSLQISAIKMIDDEILSFHIYFSIISIFIPSSLLLKCPLFTTATDRCLELSFVFSIVHWCPFLTNFQRQGTIYSVFQS